MAAFFIAVGRSRACEEAGARLHAVVGPTRNATLVGSWRHAAAKANGENSPLAPPQPLRLHRLLASRLGKDIRCAQDVHQNRLALSQPKGLRKGILQLGRLGDPQPSRAEEAGVFVEGWVADGVPNVALVIVELLVGALGAVVEVVEDDAGGGDAFPHGGLELGAVVEKGAVAADGDYRALGRGELGAEPDGVADADGGEALRGEQAPGALEGLVLVDVAGADAGVEGDDGVLGQDLAQGGVGAPGVQRAAVVAAALFRCRSCAARTLAAFFSQPGRVTPFSFTERSSALRAVRASAWMPTWAG